MAAFHMRLAQRAKVPARKKIAFNRQRGYAHRCQGYRQQWLEWVERVEHLIWAC